MLTLIAGSNEVSAGRLAKIIHREGRWFDEARGVAAHAAEPRISASRSTGQADEESEQEAEIEADRHVIDIALQPMEDVTVFARFVGETPNVWRQRNQAGSDLDMRKAA
jgi:hypothetical protein